MNSLVACSNSYRKNNPTTLQVLKGHFHGAFHYFSEVILKITLLSTGNSLDLICFSGYSLLLCFSSWQCWTSVAHTPSKTTPNFQGFKRKWDRKKFSKHVLSLPECIAVANKAKIWLLLVKMNSGVKKELRRATWHLQQ